MRRLALACVSVLGLAALGGPAASQQDNNPSFNLVNRAQVPINEVYATPKGQDTWGKDRLTDTTVAPGASFPVRLPLGQCTYDVRVVYGNGRAEERRGLDTCSMNDVVFDGSKSAAVSSQGSGEAAEHSLSFTITNLSKTTISSVFATPTGVDNWGRDRLGDQGIIEHDATTTINLPNEGKCIYDIRFVYSDDSTFEKRKVDLCHDPVSLRVN
ncbi:MAG: hypothetical protein JO157_07635 [Acetobacteraceae bacterium]|nr:hypothetical protein [Acetobacteraceae bacterium]